MSFSSFIGRLEGNLKDGGEDSLGWEWGNRAAEVRVRQRRELDGAGMRRSERRRCGENRTVVEKLGAANAI